MSPHDMIKKKTKEVEAQAGPVEIQRKREEAMFVQSITRQYEEARKQETKLARQLRQGPPDSVIKKRRWMSFPNGTKSSLERLREREKKQFPGCRTLFGRAAMRHRNRDGNGMKRKLYMCFRNRLWEIRP